jgi:hypothetical protein
MNQRITKLVRQALKDSVSIRVESVIAGSIDGHGIIEIPNSFTEKFAELIVRECMRMCDVAAVGYDTHNHIKEANGCCSAKEYIAEHFGVEE